MFGGITIVAEVKMKSPFGFISNSSWEEQFKLAEMIGDIISVHTDSRWGGSLDEIRKARALTKKPILAKGIHETDDMIDAAVKAGADYVFVVGRYLRSTGTSAG
jgi:indole-3-glycerol phosphate synthase